VNGGVTTLGESIQHAAGPRRLQKGRDEEKKTGKLGTACFRRRREEKDHRLNILLE